MSKLSVTYFDIPGPALIRPVRHGDDRGFFSETWNTQDWTAAGLPHIDWVQDNEAFSAQAGTLRGLHFQAPPCAQTKLIRAVSGAIFDVAVDIRQGSPTYGKSVSTRLESKTGDQLLVPHGFAHGYQTLATNTIVAYKCDNAYAPDAEGGLLWSCATLGISWPKPDTAITNQKDLLWPALSELNSPFTEQS